jgi:hypothetical protein
MKKAELPFAISSGETKKIAYGLVMGNGPAELQIHADTLAAIYERLWWVSRNWLPAKY